MRKACHELKVSRGRLRKHQAPNNDQFPMTKILGEKLIHIRFGYSKIGICLELGIWSLEFLHIAT
jgi:hypothetical protein